MRRIAALSAAIATVVASITFAAAPAAEAASCYAWRGSGFEYGHVGYAVCYQDNYRESFNHRVVVSCPGWTAYGAWKRPNERSIANCGIFNAGTVRYQIRWA